MDLEVIHYEPNPKHKLPCQPGRKGAICPKWSGDQALSLLKQSLPSLKGSRRYATINGVAFCGQEHRPGVLARIPDWMGRGAYQDIEAMGQGRKGNPEAD